MTKNGISSEQKYNSKGELVSVSDPAGKITYNLRPDGQLSSVVAPGDITTAFEYDEYGRRKAIVDPSAGRKTFTYDEAGNLKEETDADNRKKIYLYDAYGRIISKEFQNEFKTTYNYEREIMVPMECGWKRLIHIPPEICLPLISHRKLGLSVQNLTYIQMGIKVK